MSNTPPFDRLMRPQRIALISILSGDTPSRTASLARVTARSVRNWRKLPVFQEALADARRDYFSACRSLVSASLAVAFETVLWTSGKSWSDGDRLKTVLPPPENISTPTESIA